MRGDLDRWASLAAAWLIVAICCFAPIASMLLGAAESDFFSNIASLLEERQRTLMANTLTLGIGVAALALIIGAPLGVALARCDMRRVAIWRFVLIFPLIVPSFVLGLAWIILAGARSSQWVYSLPAAAIVLGFSMYPIVMLATEAAVRGVSSRLEEAARLVASTTRVWLKIIVPLAAPPVVASLLIVFVLCISDFAVPGLLRVRVYTTEVFTAFATLYDFRLATVTAMPLAAVAGLASLIALELIERPSLSRSERSSAGLTWTEKRQRTAVRAIAVAAIGLVVPPIAAVALEATRGGLPLGDGVSLAAIQNSVVWSASAASLVVCVAVLLGYWRRNTSRSHARAANALWVTLFAIPATVLGVGMIMLWNRRGLLGAFHRTESAIVVAYLSRFLPLGALLCAAFLQRVTTGSEEAARLSGASWMRTFVQIVLPPVRNGIAAVWMLMFVLMSGEVALTILLAPPGESNLPVRTYTLIANAPSGDVARLALLQIGISAVPLFLIVALIGRWQERLR